MMTWPGRFLFVQGGKLVGIYPSIGAYGVLLVHCIARDANLSRRHWHLRLFWRETISRNEL
jgi:hypothetical protein